jgi:hypothetical protein
MTNNPAGKPPGTKNKINAELRDMIGDFLNNKFETVVAEFDKLEPKEKLKFYTDLLNYGLPKLLATDLSVGEKATVEINIVCNGLAGAAYSRRMGKVIYLLQILIQQKLEL